MKFIPHFFYEAGSEGGGNPNEEQPEQKVEMTAQDVKELNELREWKTKVAEVQPTLTPEQIKKEQDLEDATFRKYAVENDLLKKDDFDKVATIGQRQAKDLVFDKFVTEFKEDNPEIEAAEFEAEAKIAFEKEYGLNATTPKAKERAAARLQKEAAELKAPIETPYNTAKERYNQDKALKAEYPVFNKFIDDIITEVVTDKYTVKTKDGEEEIPVEVEITKEQKKEIETLFKNPKTFYNFTINKDKQDEVKKAIAKKIEGYIKINTYDAAVAKSYETGKGIGVKQGSNVGAGQPFAIVKGGGGSKLDAVQETGIADENEKRNQRLKAG